MKTGKLSLYILSLTALLFVAGCKKNTVKPDPTITSFTPENQDYSPLLMTITGTNFSTNASDIQVFLEKVENLAAKGNQTDGGFRYPLTVQSSLTPPTETQIVAGADINNLPSDTYYKVVVRIADKEVVSTDEFYYGYVGGNLKQ